MIYKLVREMRGSDGEKKRNRGDIMSTMSRLILKIIDIFEMLKTGRHPVKDETDSRSVASVCYRDACCDHLQYTFIVLHFYYHN